MLSGEYNFLVDNMGLTDIISTILLILPFFLIFSNKKLIFGYYVVSIVANLPLIFFMSFGFSYEIIIGVAVIISIIKDLIINKSIKYVTTKESIQLIIAFLFILFINLLTSVFNFNQTEYITRLFLYSVNLFILFIFTYFLVNRQRLEIFKVGFILGAIILVITMIVEMLYGYKTLNQSNLRPAGLLLDPNVCAFALNLSLIVSFYKTRKTNLFFDIFYIISRVLIIFGIFITVSRSAYISTLVILVMFLIYYSQGKNKWIAATTVIIFVLMYFIFFNILNSFIKTLYGIIDLDRIFPTSYETPSDLPGNGGYIDNPDYSNSRLTLIVAGIRIFINNFIIGVGIGNVVDNVNALTGLKMNSHNLILQLMAESGFFIFVAILIFIYYLIKLIAKSSTKKRFYLIIITIVIAIESMFNHNLLNINIIWLILSFCISISVIYSIEQKIFSFNKEIFRRYSRK